MFDYERLDYQYLIELDNKIAELQRKRTDLMAVLMDRYTSDEIARMIKIVGNVAD